MSTPQTSELNITEGLAKAVKSFVEARAEHYKFYFEEGFNWTHESGHTWERAPYEKVKKAQSKMEIEFRKANQKFDIPYTERSWKIRNYENLLDDYVKQTAKEMGLAEACGFIEIQKTEPMMQAVTRYIDSANHASLYSMGETDRYGNVNQGIKDIVDRGMDARSQAHKQILQELYKAHPFYNPERMVRDGVKNKPGIHILTELGEEVVQSLIQQAVAEKGGSQLFRTVGYEKPASGFLSL